MKAIASSRRAAALALACGLLAAASEASAHARVIASTPGRNAVVAAPQVISLTFSEKLEPKFSKLSLAKADGTAAPVTSEVSAKNRAVLNATVKGKLVPGVYKASWEVVSADGHKMKGALDFTVR
jgi:methionine-rich copper-binding protein CopC